MARRSVSYETGERMTHENVTNVLSFSKYAQQELGLSLPLGNGRRQGWYKFLGQELVVQGWQISDLVDTVDFIKARRLKCHTPQGILWYVADSIKVNSKRTEFESDSNLHTKVANALAVETDDGWARRLSLAKGKALELVYANWVAERAVG